MRNWILHHFRLTLFSSQQHAARDAQSANILRSLFSVEGDFEESRGNRAVRRRQATVNGIRVESHEQPFRVDLIWANFPPLEAIGFDQKLKDVGIGQVGDVNNFAAFFEPLFEACHGVIRVAFGGLLYIPAESPAESYAVVQELVPEMNLTYGVVSDFQLQLNRPTTAATTPPLVINRVSVLSCAKSLVLFGLAPNLSPVSASCWTQMSVDVNTDGDRREDLDRQQLSAVKEALLNGVIFLAEGGR